MLQKSEAINFGHNTFISETYSCFKLVLFLLSYSKDNSTNLTVVFIVYLMFAMLIFKGPLIIKKIFNINKYFNRISKLFTVPMAETLKNAEMKK